MKKYAYFTFLWSLQFILKGHFGKVYWHFYDPLPFMLLLLLGK